MENTENNSPPSLGPQEPQEGSSELQEPQQATQETEESVKEQEDNKEQADMPVLTDKDVPEGWVNFKGPNDFVLQTISGDSHWLNQPPTVWQVANGPNMRHYVRLYCHFEGMAEHCYIPITFLLDTCAVNDVHWSKEAQLLLSPYFSITFADRDVKKRGDSAQTPPTLLLMRNGDVSFTARSSPAVAMYEPMSVLGLRFTQRFPLVVSDMGDFSLKNMKASVLYISKYADI